MVGDAQEFREVATMSVQVTYTEARARLAGLWDKVTDDREVVIITRRGAEAVALIAADELAGLQETAHLLRSPKNAQWLLAALRQALEGEGTPVSVEHLRRDLGLDEG